MGQLDQTGDQVLRAAFQISCGTDDRVAYDQMKDVVPLTREELRPVVAQLQARGLVVGEPDDAVELTPDGLTYASSLPPISEPPLMQDA